jgi:hypothetical protein
VKRRTEAHQVVLMIMGKCIPQQKGPDNDDTKAVDKYLNVELVLREHGGLDSEPIGLVHANPLIVTCEYEIKFADGTHKK